MLLSDLNAFCGRWIDERQLFGVMTDCASSRIKLERRAHHREIPGLRHVMITNAMPRPLYCSPT